MELHCPHCQKQLIIEDQYAGQQMKCPMCEGTFEAPFMPSYTASESSLPTSPEQVSPSGEAPPQPGGMPPAQPDASAPPMHEQPYAPPPYEEPVRSTVYRSQCGIYFSPDIIQWVVVGALVLIFLFSFFPWVTFGYGGVSVFSQNGWQAAFGGSSFNEELAKGSPMGAKDEWSPGVSVLSIFYVLLLILTFPLVTAVAVLSVLKLNLPPGLRMALNFKWVIAGTLIIIMFFLLFLQVLTGFSAESKIYERAIDQMPGVSSDDTSLEASLQRGMVSAGIQRGFALSCVFWLHLLAVIAAGFMCWMDLRKTAPIPKLDFHW